VLGEPLGDDDGTPLGETLGDELGPVLGEALGPSLGESLGDALGPLLGEALGPALGTSLGEVLGAPLGDSLGPTLGEALGPKLILGMTLGGSVLGGERENGEGVLDRSWHSLSPVIPTGPFVSTTIFVANVTASRTFLTPSEPSVSNSLLLDGETTISTTSPEESVM
jgi:hypothetical protein